MAFRIKAKQPQCRIGKLQDRPRIITFLALQDTETDTQQSEPEEVIGRTLKPVEYKKKNPSSLQNNKINKLKLELNPFVPGKKELVNRVIMCYSDANKNKGMFHHTGNLSGKFLNKNSN